MRISNSRYMNRIKNSYHHSIIIRNNGIWSTVYLKLIIAKSTIPYKKTDGDQNLTKTWRSYLYHKAYSLYNAYGLSLLEFMRDEKLDWMRIGIEDVASLFPPCLETLSETSTWRNLEDINSLSWSTSSTVYSHEIKFTQVGINRIKLTFRHFSEFILQVSRNFIVDILHGGQKHVMTLFGCIDNSHKHFVLLFVRLHCFINFGFSRFRSYSANKTSKVFAIFSKRVRKPGLRGLLVRQSSLVRPWFDFSTLWFAEYVFSCQLKFLIDLRWTQMT